VGRRFWKGALSKRFEWGLAMVFSVALCASSAQAHESQTEDLNSEFQSASAAYDAGRYAEAEEKLERLLPRASDRFEVQELLGMVYFSLQQDAKAIEHLDAAVQLKPDSAVARTNLAATLTHAGNTDRAGEQFRKALELEPNNFDANHNLGEFYVKMGKLTDALPFLQQAQQINPSSYDNGYDLALADFLTGQLSAAKQMVQVLLEKKNTGELHDLLGQIDEKDGKFVAAENEFETASHLDPSEEDLFDWGSELLLHRTYEPAIQVFREATRRFPTSPRLMIGLGMALDLGGKFDEAVTALIAAVDLAPTDARCYLFLSQAFDSSPSQAQEVKERFHRYAGLQPANALAQYYYALSLWKGSRAGDANPDLQAVESLLKRSIALDEKLPEPHLQLGNLYADRHDYAGSVPEYVRALELNPNLADAHFRLGTDYVHLGKKDKAQEEFEMYKKLRAQHLAEVDKEKAEVEQFVYSSKSGPSVAH
jgi:tetratricopeptide (TPR) repeat protein